MRWWGYGPQDGISGLKKRPENWLSHCPGPSINQEEGPGQEHNHPDRSCLPVSTTVRHQCWLLEHPVLTLCYHSLSELRPECSHQCSFPVALRSWPTSENLCVPAPALPTHNYDEGIGSLTREVCFQVCVRKTEISACGSATIWDPWYGCLGHKLCNQLLLSLHLWKTDYATLFLIASFFLSPNCSLPKAQPSDTPNNGSV